MSETVRKQGRSTGYILLVPGGAVAGPVLPDPVLLAGRDQPVQPGRVGLPRLHDGVRVEQLLRRAQGYWPQLVRSLVYGGIATLFCLILGYVLAYAIAFKAGRWKNLMLVLVIAPFFTSFLVRTLSWKLILADDGVRGEHPAVRCTSSARRPPALHAVRGDHGPDLQLPAVHGAAAVRQHRQDRLPADRGRPATSTPTRSSAFCKVTWPLSLPGVVSGTLLTFIPAVGDYINDQLLGSTKTRMIGNTIQDLFTQANDYPAAAALSVMLMVLIVALVLVYVKRAGTEDLL